MRKFLILIVTLVSLAPAFAVEPNEILSDPVLEARARALSKTLRCMVCQNESIDDSSAPLAKDLRVLVRERVQKGDTDAEVRDFLIARYGDFILLQPRLRPETILLWGIPVLVLLAGAGAMVLASQRRQTAPARALSAEEKKRLNDLLGNNKKS